MKVPKEMIEKAKKNTEDIYTGSFSEDTNTEERERIVCPYCGHIDNYPYEYIEESGTSICDNCDEEFEYKVDVTVKYSTYKKEK